ncbi:MAG: hypothetical protein ACREMJ_02985, partial [Gemmatimonadales bacterium]
TPDLAGSWVAYERLVGAGVAPASLDDLLAGGTRPARAATPTVAARPAPAPSPPVRPAAPRAPTGPPVVDIRTLLYRGARAQQRAQELRERAQTASGDELRALVDEVCDLVALATEPGA